MKDNNSQSDCELIKHRQYRKNPSSILRIIKAKHYFVVCQPLYLLDARDDKHSSSWNHQWRRTT